MFIRPILGVNFQVSSSLRALSPFAFPVDLWLPCKSNLFSAENQHKMDVVGVQRGVLLLTSQGSTPLPSVQQKDQVMLRSNCVPGPAPHQFEHMLRDGGSRAPQRSAKMRPRFSPLPDRQTHQRRVLWAPGAVTQGTVSWGRWPKLAAPCPLVVAVSQACTLGKIPIHHFTAKSKRLGGKITLRRESDDVVQVHALIPLMMLFKHYFLITLCELSFRALR